MKRPALLVISVCCVLDVGPWHGMLVSLEGAITSGGARAGLDGAIAPSETCLAPAQPNNIITAYILSETTRDKSTLTYANNSI